MNLDSRSWYRGVLNTPSCPVPCSRQSSHISNQTSSPWRPVLHTLNPLLHTTLCLCYLSLELWFFSHSSHQKRANANISNQLGKIEYLKYIYTRFQLIKSYYKNYYASRKYWVLESVASRARK